MKTLLFFSFLFFSSTAFAQQITFEKIIDTLGCQSALSIQETLDGGYVFCGTSGLGGNSLIVLKMDSTGTIEWVKVFDGTSGIEGGTYVEQLLDSGYLVNAIYNAGNNGKHWLLRLNHLGDTLWTNTFTYGNGGVEISNGNNLSNQNNIIYGMSGYYKPQPNAAVNACFSTSLSNGFPFTNKIYPLSNYSSSALCIDKTYDGGFVMAGAISVTFPQSNILVMRTDAFGDTLWTKQFDYSHQETAFDVKSTIDSGFVVAGYVLNAQTLSPNMVIIKLNSNGDSLWTKIYMSNTSQGIYSISQTMDSAYICTGYDQGDILFIKIDLNGDTLWSRTFGNFQTSETGYFVRQTKDKGFIISGETQPPLKAYIIKTDSLGLVHSNSGLPELNNPYFFNVFPNPTAGLIDISVKGIRITGSTIEVYNSTGQMVNTCRIHNNDSASIDLSHLQAGLYLIMLNTTNHRFAKKIILNKN